MDPDTLAFYLSAGQKFNLSTTLVYLSNKKKKSILSLEVKCPLIIQSSLTECATHTHTLHKSIFAQYMFLSFRQKQQISLCWSF